MKHDASASLVHAFLPTIEILALFALIIFAAGGFRFLLNTKLRRKDSETPYLARPFLLSEAEHLFYESLYLAIGQQYCIYPKVRLGDIVDVRSNLDRPTQTGARNRINQKHVDFVLCSPGDYRIVAVVELDDSSHKRRNRIDRDNFVDDTLYSVGIPILHVRAAQRYSPEQLASQVEALFSEEQPS